MLVGEEDAKEEVNVMLEAVERVSREEWRKEVMMNKDV